MEANLDHIHLLIDCSPQHYIPDMIKALKGVSARLLLKEFPELKQKLWGGHLWNPSYFVATVSQLPPACRGGGLKEPWLTSPRN